MKVGGRLKLAILIIEDATILHRHFLLNFARSRLLSSDHLFSAYYGHLWHVVYISVKRYSNVPLAR